MKTKLKGVWIATVYNLDWPSNTSCKYDQQSEFINILDNLVSLNVTDIFVQIRPASDAFYNSYINPYSEYLTKTQGKYPGYDPLEFMIKEAHKRCIKIHGWLNPYRITTSGTDLGKLHPANPARVNPSWVLKYNDALFYNPELEDVINYIGTTIYEILNNYNIDGIHFDDYFYPYNYSIYSDNEKDSHIHNNRREAVNNMVRLVHKIVKSKNEKIKFGISPFGIYKNKSSDPIGSNTTGSESYYTNYSDTLSWIKEGIIDYVAPQIYWTTDNKSAPYEDLVRWWSSRVKETSVDLYIGQNITNPNIASEINKQNEINTKYNVDGNIIFSASDYISIYC